MAEYIVGTDGDHGNWLTGIRLVRCRDCKHVGKLWSMRIFDTGFPGYMLRDMDCMNCDPNGFCAWGERKVDAQDRGGT